MRHHALGLDIVLAGGLEIGVAEQVGRHANLLGGAVHELGNGAVPEQMGQTALPKACLVPLSICARMAPLPMGPPSG
jgi:hypothetical protein